MKRFITTFLILTILIVSSGCMEKQIIKLNETNYTNCTEGNSTYFTAPNNKDNISIEVVDFHVNYTDTNRSHVNFIVHNNNSQNVTFERVYRFLENDTTDLDYKYDKENFDNLDYAIVIKNNAEVQGIRCGIAEITYQQIHEKSGWNIYVYYANSWIMPDGDVLLTDSSVGGDSFIFFEPTGKQFFQYINNDTMFEHPNTMNITAKDVMYYW